VLRTGRSSSFRNHKRPWLRLMKKTRKPLKQMALSHAIPVKVERKNLADPKHARDSSSVNVSKL